MRIRQACWRNSLQKEFEWSRCLTRYAIPTSDRPSPLISLAPQKSKRRRMKSSSSGISFDRIDQSKREWLGRKGINRSSLSNASYDRIGRSFERSPGAQILTAFRSASTYQMSSSFRIGIRFHRSANVCLLIATIKKQKQGRGHISRPCFRYSPAFSQALTSKIRCARWLNRFPVRRRLNVFVHLIVILFFPVLIHAD